MAFLPYLNFGGNCREAFTRYQEVFGGELSIMGAGDLPEGEEFSTDQPDFVVHAALTFPDHLLMASDDPTGNYRKPEGMYVHYEVTDIAEGERVFKELSDGGEVRMPFEETFWAERFGMCVDRFAIPWMISVERAVGA
jgi:PhnB protein